LKTIFSAFNAPPPLTAEEILEKEIPLHVLLWSKTGVFVPKSFSSMAEWKFYIPVALFNASTGQIFFFKWGMPYHFQ